MSTNDMKYDNSYSTIEQQIFSWQDWYGDLGGYMMFDNVELIVPVDQYPIGQKFSHAVVDNEHSLISFYDTKDNGISHTYKLIVKVGEKVNPNGD